MGRNSDALALFHPLVARWFGRALGAPSDIQTQAWPEIAAGKHVLVTAPTGSGKTLTAFLWALNQLITGTWTGGQVRVLYVSPLKALNNDVRKNLKQPLAELHKCFHNNNREFPVIRVQTRSGDTPSDERRRMLKKPPEILITTPESLNILVSSKQGRRMLTGIRTVILDEIHAVVSTKRGTHLMTAVDRLVPLCGEFQRIALSATVRPLDTVAAFVGGYRMKGAPADPAYHPRPVSIIQSKASKTLEVEVRYPPESSPNEEEAEPSIWPRLTARFQELTHSARSTLFFTNSRRLTEKIARLMNEDRPEPLAYSHHGSLSKEIRLAVETRLKKGDLRAIVATHSLELGIDIGQLDQVVLVQTPTSVSSAVQRIGRSGHTVGARSRGLLFPTHGRDFINAAVMARCIETMDIEPVSPPDAPLDVLAQVILAMGGVETWHIDHLYAFLRSNTAYHGLSRRRFDLVLDMLTGRYADTRVRELRPRVFLDRVDGTLSTGAGSLALVHLTGGTIPDRGYFHLRLQETGGKIGELDEEFVWERRVGETFALGTQTWRIRRITATDVEVVPTEGNPGIIPFWRAEAGQRDFHFSEHVAVFLEKAETAFGKNTEAFREDLITRHHMTPAAAGRLMDFLTSQRAVTKSPLPHRHHLLVEHFDDPLNRSDRNQVVLHTLWGGRVNRPLAVALSAAWERRYGYRLETFADDDAVLLILPHEFQIADILELLQADTVEGLLREKLESTGLFGACFRENAGRALLLPKMDFRRRMPLWLNRLRAKKLLDVVMGLPDFPLLLETWRTCLQDIFDLPHLKQVLDELARGEIVIGETRTTMASPFASGMIWQQTNTHMYKDDSPEFHRKSSLSEDLIREAAISGHLRPKIPLELIEALEQKLQRTAPGYAPTEEQALLSWVKERGLIPRDEWSALMNAVERDLGAPPDPLLTPLTARLARIRFPDAAVDIICAVEELPRFCRAFGVDFADLAVGTPVTSGPEARGELKRAIRTLGPAIVDTAEIAETENGDAALKDLMAQWLSFHGPVTRDRCRAVLGMDDSRLEALVETLTAEQEIVVDILSRTAETPEICDRQNLEILLRLLRKSQRPVFQPLTLEALPLFLARFQGLTTPGDTIEDLQERLEQLFGYGAPAAAWEEWILPARLPPYQPAWLDSLMAMGGLYWFGTGKEKTALAFEEDLGLFYEPPKAEETSPEADAPDVLPSGSGRWGFLDMVRHSGQDDRSVTRRLWAAAWNGRLGCDAYAPVRNGILNRFKADPLLNKGRPRSGGRGGFNRWKAARPLGGHWFRLDALIPQEADPVARLETDKDRVRQLLSRYGLLFRELLKREAPALQWSVLFKALRLMELSGEVLSGCFFHGIHGVQFISPAAFRLLQHPLPEDAIYWMNATDPASVCGLGIKGIAKGLPPRHTAACLVFHGKDLVLVSRRNGLHLDIRVPPDHPHLHAYLACLKAPLQRAFRPKRGLRVEHINQAAALDSPYGKALTDVGFTRDYKGFELRRAF